MSDEQQKSVDVLISQHTVRLNGREVRDEPFNQVLKDGIRYLYPDPSSILVYLPISPSALAEFFENQDGRYRVTYRLKKAIEAELESSYEGDYRKCQMLIDILSSLASGIGVAFSSTIGAIEALES